MQRGILPCEVTTIMFTLETNEDIPLKARSASLLRRWWVAAVAILVVAAGVYFSFFQAKSARRKSLPGRPRARSTTQSCS